MIDVQGVSKRYGEKIAVDDLTFQMRSVFCGYAAITFLASAVLLGR